MHFLIRTDHGALKYLFSFKDPQGQMAKWLQVLDTYDFEIEHRAGKRHGNSDAMSREPCKQCGDELCPVMRSTTRKQSEKKRVEQTDAGEELNRSPSQEERFKKRCGRPRKRPEVKRHPKRTRI